MNENNGFLGLLGFGVNVERSIFWKIVVLSDFLFVYIYYGSFIGIIYWWGLSNLCGDVRYVVRFLEFR